MAALPGKVKRGRPLPPLQQGWAIAGLSTLVLVAVVASSNFNEIYKSQKDFVAGSLLSLAGFCFGRAFSRTHEQKALELIRGAPTPQVSAVLQKEARASLHDRGVFESLTRLERDLQAANDRISEFYDARCRGIRDFSEVAILRVALDDLDRALSTAMDLRGGLDASEAGVPHYVLDPAVRLELLNIARDYREAIGRRDQACAWYGERLDRQNEETWDIFEVMTSDMLKGERLLSALLARSVLYPPEQYLRLIAGYIHASIKRAHEFVNATDQMTGQPKIFDVMLQDLNKGASAIDRIEIGVNAELREGHQAQLVD